MLCQPCREALPAGLLMLTDIAAVGSFSSCRVLVAHHLSASGVESPAGLEAVDAPAGIGDFMG
jgi:hypothetical protein